MSFILITGLSGCSKSISELEQGFIKTSIKIAYLDTEDKETVKALDIFSKKLSESNGNFIAEYSCEENPIKEMKNGNSQIAIIDSEMLKKYGNEFAFFTTPFYFLGAEQSTMTLNSEKFYDIYEKYFEKNLNCKLLGSVFLSADFMVFTKGDLKDLRNENLKTPIIASDENIMRSFFEKNNIKVYNNENYAGQNEYGEIYIKSKNELFEDFLSGQTIYIPENPFRVNTQWILINNDYWNSLSQNQQYELKNCISYFCGTAETERLEEYNNLNFELSKKNINAVSTYCGEIRLQCHSFVKSNLENIDINLYNEVLNIIS